MADSTVSFFLEKLTNLAIQEASLFGEVEGQITLLRNELPWMRLFLRQASMNRTSDERLRLWVDQMRDVCYDAEDVVDDFMYRVDHVRQQRLNNLKCLRPFPQCIGFSDKLLLVHDLKVRMEQINITVEKILVNKTRYGIENPKDLETWSFTKEEDLPPTEKVGVVPDRNVGEVDFVGMQSQVERVKDHLLKGTGVVSIFGIGGLGKTTLARRVYNDSNVKRHFDCRVWVSVSQEYRIGELLMLIANSVMTPTPQQKRRVKETELGNTLRHCLESKTYLIALDDLWSPQVLVDLISHFPQSDKSRVLITTRILEVAQHASSHQVHVIRPLSRVDSWELFLKKVFRVTTTEPIEVQSDLEELREAVVDKCQGSPLSIALLGGLLSGKQKTPESWNQVLQRIKRHGDDHQPFYLWILSWSYNNLPFYLKSCFLYCGLFPEDHEISTRKLINLWIAEGFIQKRGEETLEEVAEDYLIELIQRGLILVGKRRLDGGVKSCYIHDMVRDFIISEVKQSRLFEVCQKINSTTPLSPRRLSFHHHAINHNTFPRLNGSRLRSLICFSTECFGQKCLDSLILGSKLLTVLDLRGLGGMNELPNKIGQLIHLKYLSLRESSITRLPKSIGKLVNLQALDLRDSPIERIPHTIWKLRQLRQLYGGSGVVFSPFVGFLLKGHSGFGELINLQILAIKWGGWLEDGGLGKLIQLRKLKIQGTETLPSRTELELFQVTPFSLHTYLYKLFIKGRLNKLPEESKFYPPNLMKLKLKYSRLDADPMLTLEKLPNLRILQLLSSSYLGRKMVCSFEGFLKLESLTLSDLSELEELSLEKGAMRGLRSLKIEGCPNMRGLLHYGLLHLQNLQQVKLKRVKPELKEEFEIAGEEFDKIYLITR